MKAAEGLIDFAINSICINSFTFGFVALHYGDNTVMNELQLTCEKIQFIKLKAVLVEKSIGETL